jgi:primosomal protein N' (replication factor Y)
MQLLYWLVYKAKVLLGSATPSIETYFNGKSGKYGLENQGAVRECNDA